MNACPPYRPASLGELRNRLPAALEPLFDIESIQLGVQASPQEFARHYLDTACGIRLVVSRELTRLGSVGVRLAAILVGETPFYAKMARMDEEGEMRMEAFMTESVRLFRKISGFKRQPRFLHVSAALIPHWWYDEADAR